MEKLPLIIEEEETSSFKLPLDTPPSPMGSPRSETPPRKVSLHDTYQHCDFALFASEPTCFEDAVQKKEWNDAMKEEINAIERNKTWRLVDLPPGKDAIGLK